MIQQVQNSFQFHGLSGDDANKHLDKFLHVTQSIEVNGVTDDVLRLYLFPHSLTHHATAWFDRLPRNSITTFEQMAKMFLGKYFPPSMVTKLRNEITNFHQHTFYNGLTLRHRDTINVVAGGTFMKRRPEECYDLIENMTTHHNDWDTSVQRTESSSSITSFSDLEIVALKAEMAGINKNLMIVLQINQQVKAVTHSYETCGGTHSYNDFLPTVGQTQMVYAAGAYNQGGNSYQPQGNHNLLSYRSDNYLGPPRTWYLLLITEAPKTSNLRLSKLKLKYRILSPLLLPLLTGRALIDVYEGELTLRVGNKAVTFNLDQTSRYSANYDAESINQIDVIDVACEEYSQEVLGFSVSGNPTPSTEPIVLTSSPTLTPFGDNDFLLEETDVFLAMKDEPISPEINESYYDSEADILLLE
nr:reverse transcriptase domain-containing protein [Tanacetum cinerariifolium]